MIVEKGRQAILLAGLVLLLGGCQKKMVPAGVTGYNHMKERAIADFTVNGAIGSNLNPGSGGGGESCCVSIPAKWRPGLKATVAWVYDRDQGDTRPLPPAQNLVVDIPQYKTPGNFHVHFYENHKIKVIISGCSIGHPFYPMSKVDKLPWVDDMTKEDALESQKKGGMKNDCA